MHKLFDHFSLCLNVHFSHANLHFKMSVSTDMLVINTVVFTLVRQNKFVVVSQLINVNGLPLMLMALASFVSMMSHNLAMDNVICCCKRL